MAGESKLASLCVHGKPLSAARACWRWSAIRGGHQEAIDDTHLLALLSNLGG